jgi:hypothetical protein
MRILTFLMELAAARGRARWNKLSRKAELAASWSACPGRDVLTATQATGPPHKLTALVQHSRRLRHPEFSLLGRKTPGVRQCRRPAVVQSVGRDRRPSARRTMLQPGRDAELA